MGAVQVSVWHDAATLADVESLRTSIDDFGEPCALLLVVPAHTPLSGPTARTAAIELICERQSQILAVAIVLEGEGFWNAAVRGMFGGIASAARPGIPWHIHTDSDVAAAWISDALESAYRAPPPFLSLLQAIRELRAPQSMNVPRPSAFP